jgi:multidrug resistance efflux pump
VAHSPGRIPIPASRRLRMFCHGVLPVLAFLSAGGVVAFLMMRDQTVTGMTGELYARRTMINAQGTGMLVSLGSQPISEFTEVRQGQVIAQLDPRPLQARLNVVKAELEKAKEEIKSTRATQETDMIRVLVSVGGDAAQLMSDLARLRVELAQVDADEAVAKAISKVAKEWHDHVARLFEGKVVPKTDLFSTQKALDEANATVESRAQMKKRIIAQINQINQQLESLPKPPSSEKLQELMDNLLSPILAQIKTQEAIIKEVEMQIEQLDIEAPFDGVITQVHLHPGQAVQPGTPIFTLAAKDAPYVLTYIRNNQHIRPKEGMAADVRFNTRNRLVVPGRIVLIGPESTEVSAKQLQNPSVPEWGFPVAIQLEWGTLPPRTKDDLNPRPGELVFVRLRPDDIVSPIDVPQKLAVHGGEVVLSSNR